MPTIKALPAGLIPRITRLATAQIKSGVWGLRFNEAHAHPKRSHARWLATGAAAQTWGNHPAKSYPLEKGSL